MNRRDTVLALLTLGATAAPRIALAQARPVRIGVLAARLPSFYLPAVLKRLGELGYVEGKTIIVEYRSAQGVAGRFPPLARELIQAKCDLIFALGPEEAARAVIEAKADVPIVILAVDYDPVKAGIVSNLARPGGNVTGMFLSQPTLAAKRLQLMREMVPKAKRFLVLADPFTKEQVEAVRQAAEQLRVEIVVETFAALPYDLESAFVKGRAAGVDAVIPAASPVFADQRTSIAGLAMKHRLPSAGPSTQFAEAGFLFSYGVKPDKAFARAGDIAASILKGAKPGDIGVEQTNEFEFVVNLTTAKTLGIAIPPSIAVRADRAIE
jgi:putative ABC transport system substrate-binding protein